MISFGFLKFSCWEHVFKLAIANKLEVLVGNIEVVTSDIASSSGLYEVKVMDFQSKSLSSSRSSLKSTNNVIIRRLEIIDNAGIDKKTYEICIIGLNISSSDQSLRFPSIPEMRNKVFPYILLC